MKIIASIQARMGSSRLPGKVLTEVCGKPLLLWQVERIQRARLIDDIIIATTTNIADDAIEVFCKSHQLRCFRGSEDDVLARISTMVREFQIEHHVEFCGDSSLIDPHIVDEVVGYYLKYQDDFDLVSNGLKTSYPPGQEVTVYGGKVLIDADKQVDINDPNREHVTMHIVKNSNYKVKNLIAPYRYAFPDIYLEVDTQEDLNFVEAIVRNFIDSGNEHFSLSDILSFVKGADHLKNINQNVHRRWKEFRSV